MDIKKSESRYTLWCLGYRGCFPVLSLLSLLSFLSYPYPCHCHPLFFHLSLSVCLSISVFLSFSLTRLLTRSRSFMHTYIFFPSLKCARARDLSSSKELCFHVCEYRSHKRRTWLETGAICNIMNAPFLFLTADSTYYRSQINATRDRVECKLAHFENT